MDIFDSHKLYWGSCLSQFVSEFLRLRNRNVGVLGTVDNKERRSVLGDMKYGRCLPPDLRVVGIVAAQKICQKSLVIGITMGCEIGRPANLDHRLYRTRVLGQGWIGIVPRTFHTQKSRQLGACGMPECADAIRIKVIFGSIGANPANRTLHVVQLRRPLIFGSMEQTVIERERYEITTGKKHPDAAHGSFVKIRPTTTMDQDHGRMQGGAAPTWLINVQQQRMSTGGDVGDVLLNGNRGILRRSRRHLCRPLGGSIPGRLRTNHRSRSEHHNSQEKGILSHDGDDSSAQLRIASSDHSVELVRTRRRSRRRAGWFLRRGSRLSRSGRATANNLDVNNFPRAKS